MGLGDDIISEVENRLESIVREVAQEPFFPSIRSRCWAGVAFGQDFAELVFIEELRPDEGVCIDTLRYPRYRGAVHPGFGLDRAWCVVVKLLEVLDGRRFDIFRAGDNQVWLCICLGTDG